MEGRLLLKDCAVPDGDGIATGRAVVVEGARVVRIAADRDEPVRPGDWAVAARGRLLLPGRVDALVTVTGAPSEEASAARHAAALRAGVTCVVVQVESNAPAAALAREARAAGRVGMRLLASAVPRGAHAVVTHEANVAFAREHAADPRVRGALALPGCGEASDELLRAVARDARALGAPVVLPLVSDEAELATHFEQHRMRPVERLERHGLLGPSTLLANAGDVDGPEARLPADRGVLLVWTPLDGLRAGGLGLAGVWLPEHRVALASRTGRDLGAQWTAAHVLAHRAGRVGRLWPSERVGALLHAPAPGLLERAFGAARDVAPAAGALADLVLLDDVPRAGASLDAAAAASAAAPVAWTVVGGRVAVREGALLGEDLLALLGAAP